MTFEEAGHRHIKSGAIFGKGKIMCSTIIIFYAIYSSNYSKNTTQLIKYPLQLFLRELHSKLNIFL